MSNYLIADAAGNLFGTTSGGGYSAGTVFEIAKTNTGYASTPTILIGFNGANGSEPLAGLITDASGDLFGTTYSGGADGYGTVFEIAKTGTGYASTPTTLVSFSGSNGSFPQASLFADTGGNLYGTTSGGGANNAGTVFKIAKTSTGYAGTPMTLVSFSGANGSLPQAGLVADAAGDLFGTTYSGGAYGYGTVFEIAKTGTDYASTPTTLVSFDGTQNGANPLGGLITDTAGNLFGTTLSGGGGGAGTVFEIAKSNTGYASTPITLVSFNGTSGIFANGASPSAGLIADAAGNLFSTTYNGGASLAGTVFEVTGTGFVTATARFTGGRSTILWQNNDGTAAVWLLNGSTVVGGGPVWSAPGPSWHVKSSGDFNGDGNSDILWQNDDGTAAVWLLNGAAGITGGPVWGSPGPSWHVIDSGDFNGDGKSDILWQNDDGTAAVWLMNGTTGIGAGTVWSSPGPSWHVISSGDFNGDGKSDILWQNDDGTAAVWLMNGLTGIAGGPVWSSPGPSWLVIGGGDFNGDGKSDILWQNDDGTVAIWLMNGTTGIGAGTLTSPGPSWHVKGTEDFNGDGKSDILWQNDDGTASVWLMDGTTGIGGGTIASSPGGNWHIIDNDRMRFINGTSSTGTLNATSESDEFVFTSLAVGDHCISGFDPTHDLIEFSKTSFADFADLQAHATTSGGSTLIALDSTTSLLIQGVLPDSLHSTNFVFS